MPRSKSVSPQSPRKKKEKLTINLFPTGREQPRISRETLLEFPYPTTARAYYELGTLGIISPMNTPTPPHHNSPVISRDSEIYNPYVRDSSIVSREVTRTLVHSPDQIAAIYEQGDLLPEDGTIGW